MGNFREGDERWVRYRINRDFSDENSIVPSEMRFGKHLTFYVCASVHKGTCIGVKKVELSRTYVLSPLHIGILKNGGTTPLLEYIHFYP